VTKHRVLHFLWTGNLGGAERAVYQVVREEMRLGEWGVGVAFGSAQGPWVEALRLLGCEVLDLRMRSATDLPRALRAVGKMREFDLHHFHVMEPAMILASDRCSGATRVYTERGGQDDASATVRKRLRRSWGGMLLRKHFHAVAGNTTHASRVAIARYRLGKLPALVTYNGIDFGLLFPAQDRLDMRHRLGIDAQALTVGSSGTFKSWKRFDRVVDILRASPTAQVTLVGDGALRGALEAQASAIGAGERLHVTGLVENVADYLLAMDVFVLASDGSESFGNSVVEAMALGIPSVVFSDSPGICEHIQNDMTGFIVKDQRELVSVIERLGADPGLRSRVGQAGAEFVRSKYTLEHMHEAYRAFYEAALMRHRGA
jgi:glycosyltransferase involved in cell wall biosynthesis